MAAFRKGHVKTVTWMVDRVNQFPSDQEMTRYISTINDKVSRDSTCVLWLCVGSVDLATSEHNVSIFFSDVAIFSVP